MKIIYVCGGGEGAGDGKVKISSQELHDLRKVDIFRKIDRRILPATFGKV